MPEFSRVLHVMRGSATENGPPPGTVLPVMVCDGSVQRITPNVCGCEPFYGRGSATLKRPFDGRVCPVMVPEGESHDVTP